MPFLRLLAPVLALALAACNQGGHTGPVEFEEEEELLPVVLVDGTTTREAILEALGPPGATYEESRLWSYPLHPGERGRLSVQRRTRDSDDARFLLWENRSYNLVLVFENGILKAHVLLRIS